MEKAARSPLDNPAPGANRMGASPYTAMKLRPRRLRFLILLIVSIGFCVEGLKMIQTGDHTGWLLTVFFGAGVIIFCVTLLPGSSYLELDPAGFTVCSLFRSRTTRWSEIDEFRVAELGTRKSVVFNYSKHRFEKFIQKASYVIADCEGALPDTYGLSADALAAMMNDWRKHADAAAVSAELAN